MFEIHGFFKENEICYIERLSRHLTSFTIKGNYEHEKHIPFLQNRVNENQCVVDLKDSFAEFERNISTLDNIPYNKILILPPFYNICKFYERYCDKIILTFKVKRKFFKENSPYLSIKELESVIEKFKDLKHKILIEITGGCCDFNLTIPSSKACTLNQAILTNASQRSNIYFDEKSGCSYFTYLDNQNCPHIVWMENTQSLSLKHNLIKTSGYLGLCWDSPYVTADGNWDALSAIFKKKATLDENTKQQQQPLIE